MARVNREKVNRLQRLMQVGLASVYCVSLLIAVSVKADTGDAKSVGFEAPVLSTAEANLADVEPQLP